MHEFGATEIIIRRVLNQLRREHISNVQKITFRRSSDFPEDVLRRTFDILSVNTPLAGAEVDIEVRDLYVTCRCGYVGQVTSRNLVGHIFRCPDCGGIREIDEAHQLEVVEVIAGTKEVPHAVQS